MPPDDLPAKQEGTPGHPVSHEGGPHQPQDGGRTNSSDTPGVPLAGKLTPEERRKKVAEIHRLARSGPAITEKGIRDHMLPKLEARLKAAEKEVERVQNAVVGDGKQRANNLSHRTEQVRMLKKQIAELTKE